MDFLFLKELSSKFTLIFNTMDLEESGRRIAFCDYSSQQNVPSCGLAFSYMTLPSGSIS